jgi:hypothetical protein
MVILPPLKIAAGALQDPTGNKNIEIVTNSFEIDTNGPQLL